VDEILGMLRHPRVVGGHVVWNVVEDQPYSALRKHGTGHGKPPGATELLINHIAVDAVRRPHDVLYRGVRQCPQILGLQGGMLQ
jgi:hypothetical protein